MTDDLAHVHNNSDNPITVPFTVGAHRRELRFVRGWNAVDPGPLDRITGGFTANGKAKGGLAKCYFNDDVRIGDRFKPRLELGKPRKSDTVHRCPVVKGARRHYRTLKAEKDEQEKRALTLLLEQTTRELARSRNGDDGLVEVDLGGGITARMTLDDAQALAKRNGAPKPASAPFDPGTMNIDDLTDAVGAVESPAEIRLLLAAEHAGKNRKGALEALAEALEILEA
jgi:hypothetical protein